MLRTSVCMLTFLMGFYFAPIWGYGDFWFISDIHVDQNYSRTGNPAHLCHEGDIPFPDIGFYGNFLCDSPQSLVNASIEAMKYIQPNPDFIIWTGDNLPHTVDFDPDWDVVFKAIKNITLMLMTTFPQTPIFPCIGNHDTFPPNVLLSNGISNTIYDGYLNKGGWNEFLPKEEWPTFRQGGFYSQVIKPGLRLISLNTILWYSPNHYTAEIEDPAHQFKWLEEILSQSALLQEKVYIIGHVPPGYYNRVYPGKKSDSTFHLHCLRAYLRILHQHSKVVIGQMFGHYHMDMFQLFQFNTGEFKSSSIIASSITPWHSVDKYNISVAVNPSIRLVTYSKTNFSLLDYDQFFMNLSKVNDRKRTTAMKHDNLYEHLYKFTSVYGVPDLSTESLVQVYELLKRNQTIFKEFFKFLTAGKESVSCEKDCIVSQLCSISCTSSDEYDFCMQTINGTNISESVIYSDININIISTLLVIILIIFLLVTYIIYHRFWKTKFRISANRVEYESFMNF